MDIVSQWISCHSGYRVTVDIVSQWISCHSTSALDNLHEKHTLDTTRDTKRCNTDCGVDIECESPVRGSPV